MNDQKRDELIRKQLVNLASDVPDLYEAARIWFIRQGSEITTALVEGLDDESLGAICHWRILLLLRGFAKEETLPAILNVLQRSLRQNNFTTLTGAMDALAVFQNQEAIHALITLLQESDSDIVKHAAILLGQTGNMTASEPLIQLLTNNNPSIRYYAAKALIMLGGSANIIVLKRHLEHEVNIETRELIIGL